MQSANRPLERALRCVPFVAAVMLACGARAADLGLMGTPQAAAFLRRVGNEFVPIDEAEAADLDALLRHRAVVCDTNDRLTGQDRFEALARYVEAGGRLFVTYSKGEELGGCTFAPSSAWGLWERLRSECDELSHMRTGEWAASPCYANSTRIRQASGARLPDTYGLVKILPDTEVLLRAEISRRQEGADGQVNPGAAKSDCSWLVRRRMGCGVVYYGMYGVFRYLGLTRAAGGDDPVIEGVLRAVLAGLLRPRRPADITSAVLRMDVNDADADYRKTIFLNGEAIGPVPAFSKWPEWKNGVTVSIPPASLAVVARRNDIMVTNEDGDPFKIRNVRLEVVTSDGVRLQSDLCGKTRCAFLPGWPGLEGELSAQATMPLPMISLALPEGLGAIEQPRFSYAKFYGDGRPLKVWHGLDRVGANSRDRTLAFVNRGVFASTSVAKMAEHLRRYNAGRIGTITTVQNLEERADDYVRQIKACREAGLKVVLMLSQRGAPYLARIRGTAENGAFMAIIAKWAARVDTIGLDEWYFSPSRATTQGAKAQGFTEEFLRLFQRASGLSREDAQWGLSHSVDADPRARKCWEFSRQVANEFVGDLVAAAKAANPDVTTIISYITKNWNRYVAAVDDAIGRFDELLDCQTYWYGGQADDPLDAAKTTGVLGLGKVYEAEWPGKFTWLGFAPGYAGGDRRMMNCKPWYKPSPLYSFHAYYENTPAEVVPYLALQYAVSEGVFIFTLFNSSARGNGSDEDFADVVRLVSRLVPCIKGDFRKGRTAFYHDPDRAWEIYRQNKIERYYLRRQELRKATGFIEQFLDIEVTSRLGRHDRVIVPAPLWPGAESIKGKRAYVFGAPLLAANAVELAPEQLRAAVGVSAFVPMPDGVYDVRGDVNSPATTLLSCWAMDGASRTVRHAHGGGRSYAIAADHDNGRLRITSLSPKGLRQSTVRSLIKRDLDDLGWCERDCPQVNGNRHIVAVAFRDPRQAVIDFGGNRYDRVRLLVFDGEDGILRDEEMDYRPRARVDLSPFQVLVVTGLKRR